MGGDLARILKHTVILLSGSVLLGTLLLALVFCIPTERIRRHVAESADRLLVDADTVTGNEFLRYLAKNRESYTDAIIVQYAFEKIPGKNAYEHAMWAYHHDLEDGIWAAEDSLRAVLNASDASGMFLREYSRYWHGYLIYIKPLLLLFSWERLIWLMILAQLALLAAVAAVSVRKKHYAVAAALGGGLIFMKPELIVVSFTMSVCFFITLGAMLFMLLRDGWLREKRYYPEFFLCVGILTAYFDFLTYPVVTLGFPLCVYFLISERTGILESLKKIIIYSGCWGVGYAGMWASKWVVADVTLQTGTIRDAVWNVIGRTEAIGGRPRMNGGWYVISLNLKEYGSGVYGILAGVLAVSVLAALAWALYRRAPLRAVLETVFPFLIAGCIPFVWIIVVQHHSALHARFTFRILGVAAMALACMAAGLIKTSKTCKNM